MIFKVSATCPGCEETFTDEGLGSELMKVKNRLPVFRYKVYHPLSGVKLCQVYLCKNCSEKMDIEFNAFFRDTIQKWGSEVEYETM